MRQIPSKMAKHLRTCLKGICTVWQNCMNLTLSLIGALESSFQAGRTKLTNGWQEFRKFLGNKKQLFTGKWSNLTNSLAQKKRVTFVLILLLLFSGTVVTLLLPSANPFEGNLVVRELSFTSNQPNKLFLNDISGITQLSVQGVMQNISLKGRFESKKYPKLNQIKTLKFNLTNSKSQLIIIPETLKTASDLELLELRLQQDTKIKNLTYNSYNKALSLLVKPDSSQVKANHQVTLRLYLGQQPLKMIVEGGYQLPQLGWQDKPGKPEPIEFTFQPYGKDITLPITNSANLSINLPNPNQPEAQQWLRGNLLVKNVEFYTLDISGVDSKDTLAISTILQGQIRMGDRELKIEENQFLTIDEPGIKRLPYLKVSDSEPFQNSEIRIEGQALKISEQNKGLEVRIAGRSRAIKVGIDRDFPVGIIRANFWYNYLPNDVLVALISFSSAMIVALLIWLVDNLPKSSSTPPSGNNPPPAP
jgi:hypothetical protein